LFEKKVSKKRSRHDAADLWLKNHVKILLKPNPNLLINDYRPELLLNLRKTDVLLKPLVHYTSDRGIVQGICPLGALLHKSFIKVNFSPTTHAFSFVIVSFDHTSSQSL
jgi:hypothetical protein